MKSTRPMHGAYWVIIAAMAFFVMASSSPQCARSSDHALGPDLEALSREDSNSDFGRCISDCAKTAGFAFGDEKKRFSTAIVACHGDQACIKVEKMISAMVMAEIIEDRAICFEACRHSQGGGRGGQ